MKKTVIKRPEIKLVGLSVRTNNREEYNKMTGKIFPLVQRYFHQALFNKILNRKTPGTTYCAYTNYESDHTGDYTYYIGEEVSSFDSKLSSEFQTLIIPPQKYAKFTTLPAPMPDVLVKAWGDIWKMSPKELGGIRSYLTDFELYDERASDHQKIIMDLFIGID